MGSAIVKSPDAERDLDLLFDYIAEDSSTQRAEIVIRRIGQTLDTLAAMPRMGRVRPDLIGTPRVFTIWPWTIIYEPALDGDGIFVWRVLDGRRDLPNLITGRPSH